MENRRLHELIQRFMNVLNNLQQFYDVYADSEIELGSEEKRKELARMCYEINSKYVQEQLEHMKKLVHDANLPLFDALAKKADTILKKHLI